MRLESILKKLKEINNSKDGKDAKQKLKKLIQEIEYKVQKEEERKNKYGKEIQHLIGWYLQLWNNKPPESFGRTEYLAVIGKIMRELIIIYNNNSANIENLKEDYETFLQGKFPAFLLGDKSISRFRTVLPQLKQLQSGKTGKKWTTSENERGVDYYLQAIKEEEEPEWF